MSERVFVDTNVILRLLLGDIPDQRAAAARFFSTVEAGDVAAVISDTVMFEAIYILEKQNGVPRSTIRRDLETLIDEPNVVLANKSDYADTFRRYVERSRLSFADCHHITLAGRLAKGRFATFDKAAGKAAGPGWIEPT